MPAELPVVFAVACEDRGHHEAVTLLTDRCLTEAASWAADDVLEHVRVWLGDGDRPWFALKDAWENARARGLRPHGHFGGVAGLPEARMFRAQLLLWKRLKDEGTRLDAVVLIRDLDHKAEREAGMQQAISSGSWPFVIVGAWCIPEVEAWAIVCFRPEPEDDREIVAHARLVVELEFDPTREPERMSSTSGSSRDAKRVSQALFESSHTRRVRGFGRPLDELRACGVTCGLSDFLREIDTKLVPLLTGKPGQPS